MDTNLHKSATRAPKTQNRESVRVSFSQRKKVLLEEKNTPPSILPDSQWTYHVLGQIGVTRDSHIWYY
jgi:hypothetical protein